MTYFVGLDVALKTTAVCVVDDHGNILKESSLITDANDINQWLSQNGFSASRIGIEASNLTIWLYKELRSLGHPVTVIETRHAKAAMAAQNMKTDRNDARAIAQMMRTGWYKPVHVKSDESQRIKTIITARKMIVNQRIALDNHIRGALKVFGIKISVTRGRGSFDKCVRDLIAGDGELEAAFEPLLEIRKTMAAKSDQLERMLITAAKKDAVCTTLMSIPGVGAMTALLYKSVIDDPARFRRSRDVGAHLGITPKKYASGETDYDAGITKCGDRLLRGHLYEAAAYILRPSTKPCSLKSWGRNIAKRSSMKNARVAVARKLAVIMFRMWLDETQFEKNEPLEAA
ncbi:MAG: IS110 family transposase [Puniceicoccaceae bacterium]